MYYLMNVNGQIFNDNSPLFDKQEVYEYLIYHDLSWKKYALLFIDANGNRSFVDF